MSAPYTYTPEERLPRSHVTLRFTFESNIDISEPSMLALEDVDTTTIHINDTALFPTGSENPAWWVDEAIRTVDIPKGTINKGKNTVTLVFPFTILTNVERVYILGNFSVSLDGR